ncbi:MAG: ATPase, T2SS/T4P/T4SS family, partial [bacterium]|nr:ATPase, T2SS/T4P/T4SS family [bacterium]
MARRKFVDVLIEDNLVTLEQYEAVLRESDGRNIGSYLLEIGLLSEEGLAQTLAKQYDLRFATSKELTIEPEAVKLLRMETARRYKVIPIAKVGKVLRLGTANPVNVLAADDISLITGLTVEFVVMITSDVERALDRIYPNSTLVAPVTELEVASSTPVVRLVNQLILQAIEERASDLHIEPYDDLVKVRFRIDGLLQDITTYDKSMALAVVSRVKILSGLDISERRLPQDG